MDPASAAPRLSLVVPTYNEAENLPHLLSAVSDALEGIDHEIVVVDDDSPDQTWRVGQAWGEEHRATINVIRRTSERGLSSAVLTGMQVARGETLAVIDADLQHDERILPLMLAEVEAGADLCIGSRRADGGDFGSWPLTRRIVSLIATLLARLVGGARSTDPMSGFFCVSRSYFERTYGAVNPLGFKILLEFLARGDNPTVAEVGYSFRERTRGETKLTGGVIVDYLLALVDLRLGRFVPVTMFRYFLVGASGVTVNLAGYLLARVVDVPRVWSVVVGIQLSILWNYALNNRFTFTPVTYRGLRWLRGLAVFQLVSLHGVLIQIAVFQLLRDVRPFTDLSTGGSTIANAIAILVAAVSNFFLHRAYTWGHLVRNRP